MFAEYKLRCGYVATRSYERRIILYRATLIPYWVPQVLRRFRYFISLALRNATRGLAMLLKEPSF